MKMLSLMLVVWFFGAGCAAAQIVSILGEGRGAFVPIKRAVVARDGIQASRPSLFVGRDAGGLFAQPLSRPTARRAGPGRHGQDADVLAIRALIQEAESRRDGYDAVQHGARIRPQKPPTQMTLGEIFRWIEATPGQPHAIGRYQFIPATLRRVVRQTGLSPQVRFDARTQDILADVLLAEAGLHRFRRGELPPAAFMTNLAKIWAGLPLASGRSYYAGYAGNKATVSRSRFEAVIAQIGPKAGG